MLRRTFFSIALLALGCAGTRPDEPTTPEPLRGRVVERVVTPLPDEDADVLTIIHRAHRGERRSPVAFYLPRQAAFIERVSNRTAWPLLYDSYRLPRGVRRLVFSAYGHEPALERILCPTDFETMRATYAGQLLRVRGFVNPDGICAFRIDFPQTAEDADDEGRVYYRYRETVRIER